MSGVHCTGEFRPVVDAPEDYRISDLGEVQSHIWHRCREVRSGHASKWKTIKPYFTGYHAFVNIYVNNKKIMRNVHRLVLEAFVGPRPPGTECRHLDGNAANNRFDNLVWGTKEENQQDKVRHGTVLSGSKHGMSKLNERTVAEIRMRRANGEKAVDIAKDYGVSDVTVCLICLRKTWKHVP